VLVPEGKAEESAYPRLLTGRKYSSVSDRLKRKQTIHRGVEGQEASTKTSWGRAETPDPATLIAKFGSINVSPVRAVSTASAALGSL